MSARGISMERETSLKRAAEAIAREHGALIVEVNRERSLYTDSVTDLFLEGPAGELLTGLVREVEGVLARGTGPES